MTALQSWPTTPIPRSSRPRARSVTERWIDAAIDRLQPGGSTNLHGGLMLGFQEVDRHFDIRRNNRVILLTDGIANVGVTDAEQITADARAYNDRGIYLSTVGLGRDFNDALLSRLALQGQGAYHFIDSAEEMDKVFRKDVLGLMQKVASDVSLILRPEPGVQVLGADRLRGPAAGRPGRDQAAGHGHGRQPGLAGADGPGSRRIRRAPAGDR